VGSEVTFARGERVLWLSFVPFLEVGFFLVDCFWSDLLDELGDLCVSEIRLNLGIFYGYT
jgi:hypothetical protein